MITNLQEIFDTKHHNSFIIHSPETRAKVSAASKARRHSAETRKKMSEWQLGKTVSQQTRQRISQGNKGKPSWKHRGKQSPALKAVITPWGRFDSVKSFVQWCPTVGLVNARNNLKRAMREFPDQFYFEKDRL